MYTNKQRQVYHCIGLMFFLSVVMFTIIQIEHISLQKASEPERIERQTRMEKEIDLQNKSTHSVSVNFSTEIMQRMELLAEHPKESTTWDIISSNCSASLSFLSTEWFTSLNSDFKQFLLYRHCRYFPILMNHPVKCAGDVDLLMVIKSVITQYDRREVIRQTWGKEQTINGKNIKILFLLGTSSNEGERANHQKLLEYENYIYQDILQWDFMDSFFNLTLKEIHFLKWFSMYCRNTSYIFKGDDDVFVNVPNILEYLEASKDLKDLFVGDVLFKAYPIRNKMSKYYIPEVLYEKNYYPPYAGGGGFLMNGPLARKLYGACETLELYPIDDVFLGMCLEVLQVKPVQHNAFKTFGIVRNENSKMNREPCFFRDMIVVHKLLPPDLINIWSLIYSDLDCSKKI
ncbi:UDP-GlcNAc:betaGal beta-1,3-N-acetylglucosaminyltransferase 7-like [Triplophysa rosa]|uniref:Hexosyltransferase n=1 Tax=Triplophysa rosa TaxID=992332 RepID=A0A9W7T4K4_TRIRA|nr:UDP-GlcNAc:betaGal beta-1,3-N-acetylglucosaminyltransferase 7-like [Triplophysa rosa]XP_057184813.1 UDP-GlcNAc:betaGal beta-1,3-N-acetylglucosaminyltransferase 7-like [Triplophysa rosa]XP_057184814.1 UDP-GlcNAc:betaGal beta-1,3-N-acetylglucosaminyltransferase 7-like [Triplophysa rosa]XP_057184815.1 UDP-GlcNAc:betaGal beta-1,3-N-acetylglucosaminyltransferase 7-like [Triplophysa rosa]XP_057184816.1 UDP-GlcNAc:betaGal beta-1,3-N-acetylglucosaminyltransferase 7-like [Triplophysa rosa]KAI7789517